ncbi:MAG: dihydrodipicolinate synthase family protein [Candidatus Latescibacterota bacterium]
MSRALRGYYPIMPTAYTAQGEIDLASMGRLTRFLVDHGSQGMSPNGGDSEAAHLSVEERMRVTETVVQACGGRAGVLVGTTTVESTPDSVRLCRHAQDCGADAVFCHPGWGRRGLSANELVAYYGAVCEGLEVPVMIHGTGDMNVEIIGSLLARFPQIQYAKEETNHGPRLRQYVRELGERVTVFGPGLHYPGELEWGALGVMPSCCVPHIHARIFDLWQLGHREEARRDWNRMLPLVFWRWHTAAGEAGKVYLMEMGVFATPFVRQQVTVPGHHDGPQAAFGTRRLEEADRQEMLQILGTMGEPVPAQRGG